MEKELFSRSAPMAIPSNTANPNPGKEKPKQKKKDEDLMLLDHNNFVKTLSHKKVYVATRLSKSTKAPSMRPFPHELTLLKPKEHKDTKYFEVLLDDYEHFSESNSNGVNTIVYDADFLKIDQSKLPLEIFDNLEFEAMDKHPSEWIQSGCIGQTPFYHNQQWMWRDCVVLNYNDSLKQYEVQYIPDGIIKFVHRLNLKFAIENHVIFDARRKSAEDARTEAKQLMRLDHFINQQSKVEIRTIRQEILRCIHERICDGLPLTVPFPDQGTHLGNLLRKMTGELIHWYSYTMKKCVLYSKLRGLNYDGKVEARFNLLQLPHPPLRKAAPAIGKVECPDYSFIDRKRRVSQLHYSAQKEVFFVYRWLYDKWIINFQGLAFMETSMKTLELPTTLDKFKQLQAEHLENTIKTLRTDFRRALLDQFVDSVQDVFDFFQSNIKVYKTGALCKFFKVVDLQVSTFLRGMLLSSLDSWRAFSKNYTNIKSMSEPDSPVVASSSKHQSETVFPLELKPALFQVKLKAHNNHVILEPSCKEIESSFLYCVDKMVSTIRSLTSFDKEAMSLLPLETKIILNVGNGDPLCIEIDNVISRRKAELVNSISVASKRPLKIAAMYEEFMWLLKHSVSHYLDAFLEMNPPPVIDDYCVELSKLNDAIKKIENLSFYKEEFCLIQVDTTELREIFVNQALQMRNGILHIIITESHDTNHSIIQSYKNILERIAEKPTNERQLQDLREFIQASKKTVDDLKQLVIQTRKGLAVLDMYNVPLPIEEMALSWSTLEYPSKVEASARDVEIALEEDKIRMMDKLAMEKQKFEQLTEKLDKECKNAKNIINYEERETNAETVNALMDQIIEAKQRGDDFNMREKVFGFSPTDYSVLDKYIETLNPFYKMWNMVSDFHNSKNDWLNGDFKDLDGAKIEEDITDWWKTSYKLVKLLEEEAPAAGACAAILREETSEFRKHLPVIQSLASRL